MTSSQLVIGLGTGRCGTHSLASLLDQQPGADVQHERKPTLRWRSESDPLRHLKPRDGATLYGDVGFYYLPHVEAIWRAFPRAKFVCLTRDRTETVASFLRYLPEDTDLLRKRVGRRVTEWDGCFPTLGDDLTKEEAWGLYWDQYHERVDQLTRTERGWRQFAMFPVDHLNTEQGVLRILDFCGVEHPNVVVGIRTHKSSGISGPPPAAALAVADDDAPDDEVADDDDESPQTHKGFW